MKKSFVLLLSYLMLQPIAFVQLVSANEITHFSGKAERKYEPLHPYALNWTGDVLDRGGFSLTEGKLNAGQTIWAS